MDLKGLDHDQPIGGFDKLVLIQCKNWKDIISKNSKNSMTFLEEVPCFEMVDVAAKATDAQNQQINRLFYVIVQCLPIPLIKRLTKTDSIIVPIIMKKQQTLKQLYKNVNTFI